MFKNLTPRQIAIYSALVTALIFTILVLILYATIGEGRSTVIFGSIISVAIISYLVNLFFLKKYIYRKIKLIYKSIHQLKLHPSEKIRNIDSDENIMQEVEQEVAEWAADKQGEIEELKTLENYRREFLGNVSHELKTPIFNIQGYVHTLIDGALHDDEINTKYLERTAKNVDRLITIVDDLETISKLESGKLLLDVGQFDIKDLALEVFESLELIAAENKIKLVLKDGANQGFQVRADREYIRQVLDNLILNSIKYGKRRGMTKVGFYDMDSNILIEIADNGIGIEKPHLKHVFDRFYRVDKSRSREVGGSGLGLSIVKHIVEAHNQTINVRSTPGLGSTFGFTLEKAG